MSVTTEHCEHNHPGRDCSTDYLLWIATSSASWYTAETEVGFRTRRHKLCNFEGSSFSWSHGWCLLLFIHSFPHRFPVSGVLRRLISSVIPSRGCPIRFALLPAAPILPGLVFFLRNSLSSPRPTWASKSEIKKERYKGTIRLSPPWKIWRSWP